MTGTRPATPGERLDGVGFSVTVPESWFEVELRPSLRDHELRLLVDRRLRDQPELREHRPALVRALREVAERAWDAGCVFAACLVHPTDEGPLTATVTVTVLPAPGPATDGGSGLDPVADLAEELVGVPLRPGGDPDVDPWCDVGLVDLPDAGPGARLHGIEDVELPDGSATVRSVVMRTFVPVQDRPFVVLLSGASPVLPLAEAWFDMFDAVTGTLRLFPLGSGS